MKKVILTLSLLNLVYVLNAQDKNTTPDYFSESEQKERDNPFRNLRAVKSDLAHISSGDFNIIGEFRLLKKISVEVGAGYTLDYLLDVFQLDNVNKITLHDNAYAVGGYSTKASVKYYFDTYDQAIEGWWVGVTAYQRVNNYEYIKNDIVYDNQKYKLGVGLMMGKQFISRAGIVSEIYWGVSLVKIKRDYYYTGYNFETQRSWLEDEHIIQYKNTPNFLLGFRLGLGK